MGKLVYSNVSQAGVWGRSPQPQVAVGVWGQSAQPLGDFCKFLEKKAILISLDHICTCSQLFEKNRFLTFESQSKKFSCLILLLAVKVQSTFKILHYGVKF